MVYCTPEHGTIILSLPVLLSLKSSNISGYDADRHAAELYEYWKDHIPCSFLLILLPFTSTIGSTPPLPTGVVCIRGDSRKSPPT